jgi:hypothetical protein
MATGWGRSDVTGRSGLIDVGVRSGARKGGATDAPHGRRYSMGGLRRWGVQP